MDKNEIIEDMIKTIENEIKRSTQTRYICEDESIISTDVGYVEDWFNEYKYVLREKYCK